MKVCVFGAGAIGGHVAARLIATRAAEVSVVARGATLDAIRSRGLLIRSNDEDIRARADAATDDPSSLPPQDLVVVTLKAPAVPAAAPALARLLGEHGTALFATNGLPWWWHYGLAKTPSPLPLLDPEGALWRDVTPRRALGCVLYGPSEPLEPGVIVHRGGNRWIFGEPDNSPSERLAAAVALFKSAGFPTVSSTDLRREIWLKLVRNASNGTLSALIRQPLAVASSDPELPKVATGLITETLEVARTLGWDLRSEVNIPALATCSDLRNSPRNSTLQDVLAGRPLEVEALLGQTQAFGREAGVPVPTIDVIVPLLRALDKSLALQRATR